MSLLTAKKAKKMYCLLTVMFGLYYSGEVHTNRRLIRGRVVQLSLPNMTINELEKALDELTLEVSKETEDSNLKVVAISHSVSPIFSFDQLNLLKAPVVRPL